MLYMNTVIGGGMIMTSKTGFNPVQSTGIQIFQHMDRYYRICFNGSVLEHVQIGEKVLSQNEASKYWIGTIARDCFQFICEEAFSSVLATLGYDCDHKRMKNLHENYWFFDMQGELPF